MNRFEKGLANGNHSLLLKKLWEKNSGVDTGHIDDLLKTKFWFTTNTLLFVCGIVACCVLWRLGFLDGGWRDWIFIIPMTCFLILGFASFVSGFNYFSLSHQKQNGSRLDFFKDVSTLNYMLGDELLRIDPSVAANRRNDPDECYKYQLSFLGIEELRRLAELYIHAKARHVLAAQEREPLSKMTLSRISIFMENHELLVRFGLVPHTRQIAADVLKNLQPCPDTLPMAQAKPASSA